MPSRKTNLAVFLIALAGALYVAEAGLALGNWLRATESPEPSWPADVVEQCAPVYEETDNLRCRVALAAGLPYDTRRGAEVLDSLRRAGIEAWPTTNAHNLVEHRELQIAGRPVYPLGDISRATLLWCNEAGEWLTYATDEFGFRNPVGAHGGEEALSVVLLGDSFAQGACVEAHEDVGAVIRRAFPRTLNLGRDAAGPVRSLAALREYGTDRRPAAVVWLFYEENDFGDFRRERRTEMLMRYLEPSYRQGLRPLRDQIDRRLREFTEESLAEWEEGRRQRAARSRGGRSVLSRVWELVTLSRLRGLVESARQAIPPPGRSDLEDLREVMERARDDVQGWGGTLYFVYLPSWYLLAGEPDAGSLREELLALAREMGIPTIDITEEMRRHPDPLSLFPLRQFGHYTPEGYALVGETILRVLAEDAVLDTAQVGVE